MRVLFCTQCRRWQVEGWEHQAVQDEMTAHKAECRPLTVDQHLAGLGYYDG